MFQSSARILCADTDPALRSLRDDGSDGDVAVAAVAQFYALDDTIRLRADWELTAAAAAKATSSRDRAIDPSQRSDYGDLLDWRQSWWWLGVIFVARERGLSERVIAALAKGKGWHRSPRRRLFEALLLSDDTRGDARLDVAWQLGAVFCPQLASVLPPRFATQYAEGFVEQSLDALLSLHDIADALDRAQLPPDCEARKLLRGLQGRPARSGTITQRFASGDADCVRTRGSRQWKARDRAPRGSAALFMLAALATGINRNYVQQWAKEPREGKAQLGVSACLAFDNGQRADARTLLAHFQRELNRPDDGRVTIARLANVVAASWVDKSIGDHPAVARMQTRCERLDHTLLANLLQQVRDIAAGRSAAGCHGSPAFAALRQAREPWQDALQLLEERSEDQTTQPSWDIQSHFAIVAAVAVFRPAPGEKLKRIAAHRLWVRGEMQFPKVPWTVGERAVASLFAATGTRELPNSHLSIILELLDGRSVTLNNKPITVSRPQLRARAAEDGGVHVEVVGQTATSAPRPTESGQLFDRLPDSVRLGGRGYVLAADDPEVRELEAAAGEHFVVPAPMRDLFFERLRSSGMRVEGSAHLLHTERSVLAEATPVLRIAPRPAGLYVRAFVRPFGVDGPQFVPGIGPPEVAHTVSDQRLTTTRALDAEVAAFAPFAPFFPPDTDVEEHSSVLVDELALEFLSLLRQHRDDVRVEWPKNKPLRLPQPIASINFEFQTDERRGWLDLHGEARFDEDRVVSFAELIRLQRGRFATLSDGRVLELDAQLQQQLQAARRLGATHADGIRFSPHVALSRESEALPLGERFHARRDELQQAFAKNPRVPNEFCGTLMPYQLDGYRWLARLADAELGACLADDMGLGKTIQTLALLLRRAKLGPALVVAPTSVATNWIDEAQRFAPALHCVDARTDRERAAAPKAGDLVVTSYGLLRRDEERYHATAWATAVLDEAQAIKNPATKQARAAFGLNAAMRLACTGTPVENRLEELWSIFRFVLPGHLGSRELFAGRFARPISEGDTDAAAQLQALIDPFLLRRTKADVLRDLPEKTERVQRIRMSEDEAAFYEATRLMAEQQVEEVDPTGANRMMVLAQITRLRLACCSPALLEQSESVGLKTKPVSAKQVTVPSSKVEALRDALASLQQSGHHALVFTQFVGFLQIVQDRLIEDGLRVARLDGSTPAAKRAQLVQRFQNGEFDVFLISLKAGGTGLNLTRASYVFLLDPWWNPAVENQAADRAHRIGQQMPVTLTRFVCAGTIEERILELHREKRELADAVIGDGAASTALSVERLLSLIREPS